MITKKFTNTDTEFVYHLDNEKVYHQGVKKGERLLESHFPSRNP
jgi:hypothetical protein